MPKQKAFTLIELLVVIAIIGLLASIILVSLSGARERAKMAKAQTELSQFKTAVFRLALDTGKWPGGCITWHVTDLEIPLDDPRAGLISRPSAGVVQALACEWTADEVANWQGPYIQISPLIDPWGNSYWFDGDYWPYKNCPSIPDEPLISAIATLGPDNTWYSCDDIFFKLTF